MSFNRRDLQDDDDDFKFDDEFNFDDDNKQGGSEFKFDDEPADIGLDDDGKGFGFEDEDMPVIDEDAQGERRGTNRTFVILAALMILLFILGLAAVIFLALRPQPLTDIQQTSTAIAIANATTVAQLNATQTAAPLTQTADAEILQLTASAPTPTHTPTNTPTPSETPTLEASPTLDLTESAAFALLTQTAVSAQQTASVPTVPPIDSSAVALTATALSLILSPPTTDGQGGGEIATPTQEGGSGVLPTPGALPTALPDTGLFDDLAGGGGGIGLLALLAVGLVGVIIASRRLRTTS
ncbi:MAG: hypothetical protein JNJ61_03275 [Anaerolineae bacterium]|nr:hypothetical protein [Anaerolineae bacterium]